jgi:metal-responsive CopG/Arc/MetJ family transcriptional regulator
MGSIQVTLDDNLVKTVDCLAKELHTSRSAFTRKASQDAIVRHQMQQMEIKHREGYEQHRVISDEFSIWETEQAWGD